MLEEKYSLGTLNQRLAIVRQYCRLAHQADIIPDEDYELILTVKGYSGRTGRHVDAERTNRGQTTRKSTKKIAPTRVRTSQAHRLKRTTTKSARRRRSQQDILLTERDALLMGLLIEHALRVSEVVALDLDHFDLEKGVVAVYSSKNNETHTQRLQGHTRRAAERYLEKVGRTSIRFK